MVAKMNEKPSLHDYYWNVRDPMWVLLPTMVPGCYPGTISVNLSASELPLGSLGGPRIAKN